MTPPTETRRVPFTSAQIKILATLASGVGLRMLGLFLVLPVFTLYALEFTPSRLLAGFAFGGYGLTMALLQIPLGRLSDRIGRRKVLLLGMGLFSLGSFLCAIPGWLPAGAQIGALIVGRLVQGSGVITSVAFATVADYIQEEKRSTAMAVLGIPIGAAFIIGVIGGPMLAEAFGAASLFWLTGFLGLGTLWLFARYLPEVAPRALQPTSIGGIMKSKALLPLDAGGFIMNFFMATFFFYFPLIVTGQHHVKMGRYYTILLPMVLISGITMFAFTRGADRGWAKPLGALAFLVFVPSALLLFRPEALGFDPTRLTAVLAGGTLFYIGFTGLEPILPSMVSRSSPEVGYGTALGIYNSSQYLGSFAGGLVAGALARLHQPGVMMAMLMAASVAGSLMMMMAARGGGRVLRAAE
jgi:MFS family permease